MHVAPRIVVHCCPLLSIVIHCCPLLSIVVFSESKTLLDPILNMQSQCLNVFVHIYRLKCCDSKIVTHFLTMNHSLNQIQTNGGQTAPILPFRYMYNASYVRTLHKS